MGNRVPEEARVIGAALRGLRESSGLSLRDVAKVLGVSYQQVQKYERGDNRFPVEKLFQLRQFYDVCYDEFFRGFSGNVPPRDKSDSTMLRLQALQDQALKSKIYQVVDVLLS